MAAAVERAYEAIRDRILHRAYAPGSRLKEERLAEEIGVSRTPVREALRRLHIEGWVEFVPNQGAVVSAWTESVVEEVFAIRALLESYGAEMAARNATEAQVAELHSICTAFEEEIALLATMLAPTDAALGKAVVTNEAVPAPVREGLNVESGLNDGICVPVLFVFLALATGAASGSVPNCT